MLCRPHLTTQKRADTANFLACSARGSDHGNGNGNCAATMVSDTNRAHRAHINAPVPSAALQPGVRHVQYGPFSRRMKCFVRERRGRGGGGGVQRWSVSQMGYSEG